MKKFYAFIAMAMMVSAPLFAQKALSVKPKTQMMEMNAKKMKTLPERTKLKAGETFSTKRNAPAKKALDVSGLELITEQPAGTASEYVKSSTYVYYYWVYTFLQNNSGAQAYVVEGDDGYYYMNDPITPTAIGSWLKLEKDGDYLIAKLPQAIYHQDASDGYEELTAYAAAMDMTTTYDEDYEMDFYDCTIADKQEYRFKIDGDSIVCEDPDLVIGLVNEDGEWYGYGDFNIRTGKLTDKPLEVSDDIASSAMKFGVKFEDYNGFPYAEIIEGAFAEDGSVYVKGLYPELPDAWIKGTFDGSKATFKSGQYLGFYDYYSTYAYFVAATTEEVYDDYYDEYVEQFVLADDISFDVDLSTMTMTTDRHILVNANPGASLYYMMTLSNPEIALYTEKAATPEDPYFYLFADYFDDYGYYGAQTVMPPLDVDGNVLDTEKLTYSYYLDDEVFEVYPDEYGVEETITEIPYDMTAGIDYNDISNTNALHTFYWYQTGFDKFGVQTTYHGGDEAHSSNIVYYDLSGVEAVKNDEMKQLKSVSYTDIAGRTVANPAHGLFIKTVTFSDGTTKSVKVLKK